MDAEQQFEHDAEGEPSAGMQSPNQKVIENAIAALALTLDVRTGRGLVLPAVSGLDATSPIEALIGAAQSNGIFLRPGTFRSVSDTFAIVRQGYSVVFLLSSGEILVTDHCEGRSLVVSRIRDRVTQVVLSPNELRQFLEAGSTVQMMVAKKELECESMSETNGDHGDDGHHGHANPVARFIALLDFERRDIALVVLFAGVGGLLALATPLVVEGLVNVVSWGTYVQPLLVLSVMLLVCLGIAGVLKVLQTWVVELIQRRQFVRIVCDLAHRFPRARQLALEGEYPRELANRVFDIMTIQKATAVLLLDGVSVILTTVIGLFLLAFYHPFLLGFDLVLIFAMVSVTWVLGRYGILTAIEESKSKYMVAHWLQDVLAMPSAFKTGGGEQLAVRRANQLTSDYVKARKKQFRVVIRQVMFAVALQVIASTALLGLGGWLVINGQLTLGQLVASELVVTVVVGAFAKAGKSLEKFYDMMAGIDKVGHLIDIPVDPRAVIGAITDAPVDVSWTELSFHGPTCQSLIPAARIEAGSCVAIIGDNQTAKTQFASAVAGLLEPSSGLIQLSEFDAREASSARPGDFVGYAGRSEIFLGTVAENVGLGRRGVSSGDIRQALVAVDLLETILHLPNGLDERLQTGGYPLTTEQQERLMIARAIASKPRSVVIDGTLDRLDQRLRESILKHLISMNMRWTLIVVTNREDVSSLCQQRLSIH